MTQPDARPEREQLARDAEPSYSMADAFPEWNLPVDPVEIRVGPEGQTAVKLVMLRVGYDKEVVAGWRAC